MKYLIALLTAATGILHLLIGFGLLMPGDGTNWMLVLNGVGYLVLLVLYWTSTGGRGMIRWILLAYTLITLIGYFVIGMGFAGGTIPLVIKAIELLLVIALLFDRGSDRVPAATTPTYTRASSDLGTTRGGVSDAGATVGTMASTAGAGATTAAAAAAAATVAAADEAAEDAWVAGDDAVIDVTDRSGYVGEAVDDSINAIGGMTGDGTDYVGDRVGDAYDATAGAAGDAAADVYAAGDAVTGMTGDMSAEISDTVDTSGDRVRDAFDAAADVPGELAAGTADAVDYAGDRVDDAYDATTDAAGDAYDAAADFVGDAADDVSDAMDYAGDRVGDAYDAATDTVGDVFDAATDDVTRAGAAVGAAGLAGASYDDPGAASEPSVEIIGREFDDYLRSFGPGSEFTKGVDFIEGIGADNVEKLRAAGINTVRDLLVNCSTRRGRKQASDLTGIAQSLILTWVNHIDLYRIKGVAHEYADLLEQSGVDTVVELAQRNPANLYKRMIDVNAQKSLVRRTPHASEVQNWVEQAKSLPRMIFY